MEPQCEGHGRRQTVAERVADGRGGLDSGVCPGGIVHTVSQRQDNADRTEEQCLVPEDVGSQGPEEAFSRAGLDSVVRPPPTTAPAEQEEHKVAAGATEKNERRVRFQPAVIIEVPSWKGETREMSYGGPDKLRGTWRRDIYASPERPLQQRLEPSWRPGGGGGGGRA